MIFLVEVNDMNCPKCGEKTCVRDTRSVDGDIIRLRFCKNCKAKLYTLETPVNYVYGIDKFAQFYREYYKSKKVREL